MKPFQARFSDWKQNLSKSAGKALWMTFITIHRRDSTAIPIHISPKPRYLSARKYPLSFINCFSRYLAIKTEIYQQSLEAVSTSGYAPILIPPIRNTTAFLDSINELEKQPITLAMPTELKSLSLLGKTE